MAGAIELTGGPHGGTVVPNPHGHLPENFIVYESSKGQNPWPVLAHAQGQSHAGCVYYERTGKVTPAGNHEYEFAWVEG